MTIVSIHCSSLCMCTCSSWHSFSVVTMSIIKYIDEIKEVEPSLMRWTFPIYVIMLTVTKETGCEHSECMCNTTVYGECSQWPCAGGLFCQPSDIMCTSKPLMSPCIFTSVCVSQWALTLLCSVPIYLVGRRLHQRELNTGDWVYGALDFSVYIYSTPIKDSS